MACLSESLHSFKAEDIEVTLADKLKPKPDPDNLSFGGEFTDHMLVIEWSKGAGWGKPRIGPLQNLSVHPAASTLQFSVQLFEGMKAYRGVDNQIRIFRPEENIERMLRGSRRACLPEFDGHEFLLCLKKLLSIEKDWVPKSRSSTLYIRPTHIGTTASLMLKPPTESMLYVILTPVGPFFPEGGLSPVKLLADPQYVRSFAGGVGDHKFGGNYCPTFMVQEEAQRQGCHQVLWLYGRDHQITESGTMNVFMYWENTDGEKELITPPLDGLILPGITRKSLLDLAREWKEFKVTERKFTMPDVVEALKDKRVYEIFGCGTAVVVCPVNCILYGGQALEIPTMREGAPIARRLFNELSDIQFGRTIREEWTHVID